MDIAILGSGLMGRALGRSWARAGHHVTFCFSRDTARLTRLARETGGAAATDPDALAAAVDRADAVLLSVHWSGLAEVLDQAGDLHGKPVLSCCVPLDDANERLVVGPDTSGAEQLARMRPHARWVACFNTVPSEAIAAVSDAHPSPPPQVILYGDHAGAKRVATGLIHDAGFAPLEAGGLSTGRWAEPFAMLTAVLAYGQPGGPALTYRFDKL